MVKGLRSGHKGAESWQHISKQCKEHGVKERGLGMQNKQTYICNYTDNLDHTMEMIKKAEESTRSSKANDDESNDARASNAQVVLFQDMLAVSHR